MKASAGRFTTTEDAGYLAVDVSEDGPWRSLRAK